MALTEVTIDHSADDGEQNGSNNSIQSRCCEGRKVPHPLSDGSDKAGPRGEGEGGIRKERHKDLDEEEEKDHEES